MHSVCRIAEVLLTLQQVGNVKYTGWILQIPCSTNRGLITVLQQQAKYMEDEYRQWKETVRCRRENFYELNYFNTMQLLVLRKEFGKLKIFGSSWIVSADVLALLQSISSQVTPEIVSDVVCKERTVESRKYIEHTEQVEDTETEIELPTSSETPIIKASTVQSHLMPKLTEQDLSEKQREILANITSLLNYSRLLVLKAFEECPIGSDKFDYEDWCVENEAMGAELEVADYYSDPDSDETESTDSDESEAGNHQFNYSTGILLF